MGVASARRRGIAQLALFCVAGCGAEIGAPPPGSSDASTIPSDPIDAAPPPSPDAPPPPDAAPPDAQPCVEGDRQSQDEMTGTCYFLFEGGQSWEDARVTCQAAGGDLVRIDDSTENDLVFDLATQDPALIDLWAGGNDIGDEGLWIWLDDTDAVIYDASGMNQNILFEQWREGEPNDSDGEDCMIIEADNPAREWDDRDCNTDGPYPFICER